MKYFALLDNNNIVVNVSIADEFWDSTGWIEYTSENPATINGNYEDGFFYSPQPYPSWTRSNGNWVAPIPQPEGFKVWDEVTQSWIAE
jgi:hypothetical protein